MKKLGLISKYEHQLTLKNYSENTLKAYLNGLNIFLQYLSLKQIPAFPSDSVKEEKTSPSPPGPAKMSITGILICFLIIPHLV